MAVAAATSGLGAAAQWVMSLFISGATAADRDFIKANAGKLPAATVKELETLAAAGKLSAMDRDGRTLRQTLQGMLACGASAETIAALVHQIAEPGQILQVRDNTCAAAGIQAAIAQANPALYATLALDLTMPPNRSTLPDGKVLQVSEANRAWIEAQNLTPEARINAYVQAALMDLANGEAEYRIDDDQSARTVSVPDWIPGFGGDPFTFLTQGLSILQAQQLTEVAGGVPIINPATFTGRNAGEHSAELRNWLDKAKRDGQPGFLIPVRAETGLHMLLVLDVNKSSGEVKVYDPATGKERNIPRDEFEKLVAWDIKNWEDIGAGGQGNSQGNGGVIVRR
jgi:hypothetical protein